MKTTNAIDRRNFLAGGLAGAAALQAQSLQGQSASAAGKPNVIFFMVDQLAAKWLWGESAKTMATPNFDRLRARGTAFTNTISSNPICCPTRATLATGLTTRGHGVLQNGYELDPAIPTFARLLQGAGWRTGAFGKVHYQAHFHGLHPDFRPYGFDEVWNTEDGRGGPWLDWVEREHPAHYEAALATVPSPDIPEFEAYGPRRVNLAKRIKDIRSRFQWASPAFPHNTAGRYTLPFPEQVSQTDWITGHALQFIEAADRARPLYMHISYVQPHGPLCPPGQYLSRVDVSGIPTPAPIEWVNDPLGPKCFPKTEGARVKIPPEWRITRQYYMANVMDLDTQLGLVTAALEKAGRLSHSYIVFLSDHGELLHDHGFTGKGERHYDACVRVPLVIAGPGLRSGETCGEFVQLEDIFPTVLEMAGLPQPTPKVIGEHLAMPEGAERYPGKSLLGLCRGESPERWRDQAYIESYNNITSTTPSFWARSARTADWRYTVYPGGQGEQLFSLRNDPDEQKNLAGDAGYAATRREMRDRLLEQVLLQDYPHTPRGLFSLGVH